MGNLLTPTDHERFCADKASMVSEFMDKMFEEFRLVVDHDGMQSCGERAADGNASVREGAKSLNTTSNNRFEDMIVVNNLQADVLRRALEANQLKLRSLVKERQKRNRPAIAEDSEASNPPKLPNLPEEVISMIFSNLYFINPINSHGLNGRTIENLLEDDNTPKKLKKIIRRLIPNVVVDTPEDHYGVALEGIEEFLGPSPIELSTEMLGGPEARRMPPQTKVSVLVTGARWTNGEIDLQSVCRLHWERLFVFDGRKDSRGQRDFVLDLFQRPEVKSKLLEIEYLEIPVNNYFSRLGAQWNVPEEPDFSPETRVLNIDITKGLKLRKAKLSLPVVPILAPMLSQITDLQIAIQHHMRDLNVAIDAIRPFSSTLVNLTLCAPSGGWSHISTPRTPPPAVKQDIQIPFPNLESLKLERISEKNSRDILTIFECPDLEEISVAHTWENEARKKDIYDSSQYVSVGFLHEKVPSLRRISLFTLGQQKGLEMLVHLTQPDKNRGGTWLLPKLDTIVLDSSLSSIPRILTLVVVNRMKSRRPVSRILSVTLPDVSSFAHTLQDVYLTTLNLYVPDVKLPTRSQY